MNLNEGYWVNKCCKDSNWSKIMGDRESVMCVGCGKTTTLKFVSEWKEEFETEAVMGTHYDLVNNQTLSHLAGKYKLVGKVRIKVKKGKLTIERIEE